MDKHSVERQKGIDKNKDPGLFHKKNKNKYRRHRDKKTIAQHTQAPPVELKNPGRYATDCLFYHEAIIFRQRQGYCDMEYPLSLHCDKKTCSKYRSILHDLPND